jgi:hypothetical protein
MYGTSKELKTQLDEMVAVMADDTRELWEEFEATMGPYGSEENEWRRNMHHFPSWLRSDLASLPPEERLHFLYTNRAALRYEYGLNQERS